MTEEDRLVMEALGIRCVPKNIYHYKNFKYERLDDAVRFARIHAGRDRKNDAA